MFCIVGGSGFIGTRLSKRLNSACQRFNIIDKDPSQTFPDLVYLADVRDIDALRKSIPQNSSIINLAAEHRDDVRPLCLYKDVNVTGAHNICNVAREKNVEMIIFTSSVAVYGFAPIESDESCKIAPFNEYGRTKFEAEQIFKTWQAESPEKRTLVIIRPTVVFGEQNRGNVYNLLCKIASGRFIMVGNGNNRKSMAYVENVAAFIQYATKFTPGVHIYNFVDKPDFTMNSLISKVKVILGRSDKVGFRLPYFIGLLIGRAFDLFTLFTGKSFSISSVRVKKFCANSVYNSALDRTGFIAPVPLEHALVKTVRYEFIDSHDDEAVFYTE